MKGLTHIFTLCLLAFAIAEARAQSWQQVYDEMTDLAESDDEPDAWNYIAPYRFGAVSEGDFLVTDELLNTPLSLTSENPQAFKIPAGSYSLELNLADFTLVIGNGLRGDLNHDGMVDVTDVSLCIDMVLGKAAADFSNADLNGDGNIDVTDVSLLIDIVLGK